MNCPFEIHTKQCPFRSALVDAPRFRYGLGSVRLEEEYLSTETSTVPGSRIDPLYKVLRDVDWSSQIRRIFFVHVHSRDISMNGPHCSR